MKFDLARMHTLIWALIYGGLFLAGLGIALLRQGDDDGWAAVWAGGLAVLVGAILVWLRSRSDDPAES